MKNKTILLILCFMVLNVNGGICYQQDFSYCDGFIGDDISPWEEQTISGNVNYTNAFCDYGRLLLQDTDEGGIVVWYDGIGGCSNEHTIEMSLKHYVYDDYVYIINTDDSNDDCILCVIGLSDSLYCYSAGVYKHLIIDMNKGEWYDLVFHIYWDGTYDRYDVYVDGYLDYEGLKCTDTDYGVVDKLTFYTRTFQSEDVFLYIDDIAIYTGSHLPTPPTTTTTTTTPSPSSTTTTTSPASTTSTTTTTTTTTTLINDYISFINSCENKNMSYLNVSVLVNDSDIYSIYVKESINKGLYKEYKLLDNSLKLWLNFNNNSNIGEDNTHFTDISHYGSNATTANITYYVDSKFTKALEFQNVSVKILKTKQNINISGNYISIGAWVTFNEEAWNNVTQQRIIDKFADNKGYQMHFNNKYNRTYCNINDNNSVNHKVSTQNYNIFGGDRFIVCTYNNSHLCIYLDGVEIECKDEGSFEIGINTQDLRIGSDGNNLGYYLNGSIDELFIYDRALNKNEINYLYYRKGNIKQITNKEYNITANYDNEMELKYCIYSQLFNGTEQTKCCNNYIQAYENLIEMFILVNTLQGLRKMEVKYSLGIVYNYIDSDSFSYKLYSPYTRYTDSEGYARFSLPDGLHVILFGVNSDYIIPKRYFQVFNHTTHPNSYILRYQIDARDVIDTPQIETDILKGLFRVLRDMVFPMLMVTVFLWFMSIIIIGIREVKR